MRCTELKGYAYFVHRVRYHETEERKKGILPETDIKLIAIRKAIQDCKDKSLLTGFLDTLTPEEVNMLVTEWDMTTALEVEREEGYEKGCEESLERVAQNMLRKGCSYEQTAEFSMLSIEKIKELSRTIQS